MSESRVIEPPANFPIQWASPEEARLAWRFERWHSPDPVTPLSHDVNGIIYRAFTRGFAARGQPMAMVGKRINCYAYFTIRGRQEDDPMPLGPEEQPGRFDNHRFWDEVWLPEVQGYLARWEAFDRERATSASLLDHLEAAFQWLERCWEIHHRVDFNTAGLKEFADRVLGWPEERVFTLIGGIENKSLEGDDALRAVAATVRESGDLTAMVRDHDARNLGAVLEREPAAAPLRTLLAGYLARFGRRSDSFSELARPTWVEDPAPVYALIKSYAMGAVRDHTETRRAVRAARDRAIDEARAQLASQPEAIREEFERELAFAQRANQLSEDHNYWIDQQTMFWVRQDMLAARRLLAAAGAIAERDDVFYLRLEEVLAGLRGDTGDRRDAVAERKAEMQRWRTVEPPSQVGVRAPGFFDELLNPIFGEVQAKSADSVQGQAASAGSLTAVARVITSLADADRLQPGEVLVTKTTSPPWTPLFGIAGAIVTDGGGRISHAAVLAREYGIPAVIGAVNATRVIHDGQRVRVDGDTGTVELLD